MLAFLTFQLMITHSTHMRRDLSNVFTLVYSYTSIAEVVHMLMQLADIARSCMLSDAMTLMFDPT